MNRNPGGPEKFFSLMPLLLNVQQIENRLIE